MSIQPVEGDIQIACDPTLEKLFKKINELVGATNDDFNNIYQMKQQIAALEKEIKDLKIRMMNYG